MKFYHAKYRNQIVTPFRAQRVECKVFSKMGAWLNRVSFFSMWATPYYFRTG